MLFQDALINRYKSTFSWPDRWREEKSHQCEFTADDGKGSPLTFTRGQTLKMHFFPLFICYFISQKSSVANAITVHLWMLCCVREDPKKRFKARRCHFGCVKCARVFFLVRAYCNKRRLDDSVQMLHWTTFFHCIAF